MKPTNQPNKKRVEVNFFTWQLLYLLSRGSWLAIVQNCFDNIEVSISVLGV
jgi:hypothetical protein